MSDYSQPDFYRFNSDSLKLVQFIKERGIKFDSILDLGAGSGIIGLELIQHFGGGDLESVEIQESFLSHLEFNIKTFLPKSSKARIIHTSFAHFESDKKFDLIVCNPPYYLPGHGQPSQNLHRNIARSFIVDGWGELFSCIKRNLKMKGYSFLVIKNDDQILNEVKRCLSSELDLIIHQMEDIAILELVLIEHK